MQFFILQGAALVVFATDNMIITQMIGPEEVPAYNIAFKYFNLVMVFFTVLTVPYWSAFTDAFHRQDHQWIKNTVRALMRIWFLSLVVVVVMLVLGLVLGGLTSMITRQSLVRTSAGAGGLADILGSARETGSSGSINIPGVGAVQIDRLEEMARPMEELGRVLQDPSAAAMQPVEPQVLAALLPASVLGLDATERSSATTGTGGLGGSHARVWYGSDDNTVSLEIVDMSGAMGALAGLMSMEVDRRTASGYERVGRVNGRMTSEEWDSRTGRGTYGVLVADRVMVRARGHGVDIAQLKDVVHGIDFQSLEKAVAAK